MHSHCWCIRVSVPPRPTCHHNTPPTLQPPSLHPLPQCHLPMTTITHLSPSPNAHDTTPAPCPTLSHPHDHIPNDHHYSTTMATALPCSLTAPHNHNHLAPCSFTLNNNRHLLTPPLPHLWWLWPPTPAPSSATMTNTTPSPPSLLPKTTQALLSLTLMIMTTLPSHALPWVQGRLHTHDSQKVNGVVAGIGDRNTGTDAPRPSHLVVPTANWKMNSKGVVWQEGQD
jgi:hypothetical protein